MIRFLPFLALAGFLAELASILVVARWAGILQTLLLIVTAGFIGGAVIRSAGSGFTMRRPSWQGELGSETAAAAFFKLLAGFLLIVPGFLSDIVAGALLLPPIRNWLASWAVRHFKVTTASTSYGERRGPVIEGEAVEIGAERELRNDSPSRPRPDGQ